MASKRKRLLRIIRRNLSAIIFIIVLLFAIIGAVYFSFR
jgi:hypothetical protein